MQAYSDKSRENDPHTLPDIEVWQATAEEVAASSAYEDEQREYLKRPEFRLATMSTRVRESMLDTMIEELGITGGWCWQSCFPGCLPDSEPFGPFETRQEALDDAQKGME